MLSVNFLSSILEDNEYSLFISFLPFFLFLYFFLYMYMTHRIVIKECFPLFLSLESSKKVQFSNYFLSTVMKAIRLRSIFEKDYILYKLQ